MTQKRDADIIVVGAGPAGLSFALSLKNQGLKVLLLEKASQESVENPAPDGREIALTHLSIKLLKSLECWDYLIEHDIAPIHRAKVVNGNSPYFLDFKSDSLDGQALGYLAPNYLIRKSLYRKVKPLSHVDFQFETSVVNVQTDASHAKVTLENGQTLQSGLVIAADSRFSLTRRKMGIGTSMSDFARTAIVCRMAHDISHEQTAFECFHYERTLAILPMAGNMSSTVITLPNREVEAVMALSPEDFAEDVAQRFGHQLGKMTLVGERHSYPLVGVYAKKFVAERFALLGDAAVGMHPVTAHGFNLGLRGQAALAALVSKAQQQGQDIGAASVLEPYAKAHRKISWPLYYGTNGIVALFTNNSRPAKLVRKAVMKLANNFPPLKKAIVNQLTENKSELASSPVGASDVLPNLGKISKGLGLPKLPKRPFTRY